MVPNLLHFRVLAPQEASLHLHEFRLFSGEPAPSQKHVILTAKIVDGLVVLGHDDLLFIELFHHCDVMGYREQSLLCHVLEAYSLLKHVCNDIALELLHLVPHEAKVSLCNQKDVTVLICNEPSVLSPRLTIVKFSIANNVARVVNSAEAWASDVLLVGKHVNLSRNYHRIFIILQ